MEFLLSPKAIFPKIPKFAPLNLNNLVRDARLIDPTIYSNPAKKQALIRQAEGTNGISYGGWGENRIDMWKGTYMDKLQNYIHLGIDINVPKNTPIQLPFDVVVIHHEIYKDTDVGWGPRLVLRPLTEEENPYIVLGHLNGHNFPEFGDIFRANSPFSQVGTYPENGNVFEHLHIQLVQPKYFTTHDWDELDGYGFESDLGLFPDPFNTPFKF